MKHIILATVAATTIFAVGVGSTYASAVAIGVLPVPSVLAAYKSAPALSPQAAASACAADDFAGSSPRPDCSATGVIPSQRPVVAVNPQPRLPQNTVVAQQTPAPAAPPVAAEPAPAPAPVDAKPVTVAEGSFHDGQPGHHGAGKATLVKSSKGVQLNLTGFKATPGPDLVVLLVPKDDVRKESDVTSTKYVNVAALKSPSGDQSYAIPANIDVSQYKSVVIWCKSYSVLFAAAPLKSAS